MESSGQFLWIFGWTDFHKYFLKKQSLEVSKWSLHNILKLKLRLECPIRSRFLSLNEFIFVIGSRFWSLKAFTFVFVLAHVNQSSLTLWHFKYIFPGFFRLLCHIGYDPSGLRQSASFFALVRPLQVDLKSMTSSLGATP